MIFKSMVKKLSILGVLCVSTFVSAESKSVSTSEVTSYLTGSSLYVYKNSNSYLYDAYEAEQNDSIFDGIGYFKSSLQSQRLEAFPNLAWVPISGEITFLFQTPINLPKYAASPYVERGLIKKQLNKIIGKSWISGYGSADNQTRRLYANGLKLAIERKLSYGQNLSESFLTNIPYDVIWPELRVIAGQSVITPIVYLKNSTIQSEKNTGNTLAFGSADLSYASFEIDTARVVGQRNAVITLSDTFSNTKGSIILGGDLSINAGQSIENYSGIMSADDISLVSQKIINSTLVTRYDFGFGYSTTAENIGVISALGDISLDASGDVVIEGAEVTADGNLSIRAGNSIYIITQTEEYDRNESGSFWSDSEQSTHHIRSLLSGANIALLASNQIVIKGAVIESPGNIQLLAGMGIYISNVEDKNTFNRTFEVSSGGLLGSTESSDEKGYTSKVVETLITAGKNLMIKTIKGDIVLKGVNFNSGDVLQVDAGGEIKMLLAKETSYYSLETKNEDAFYFSEDNKGHYIETGIYNQLSAQGVVVLNATHGVIVEYADQGDNCNSIACIERVVDNFRQYPELKWLSQIYDENKDTVDWQAISLNMEKWSVHNSGLTEAGQIIVAIIVSLIMPVPDGGFLVAGEGIAAASTVSQVAVMNAVLLAGANSLGTITAVTATNNGCNLSSCHIAEIADDVISSENFETIVQAMLTAAVVKSFDQHVFEVPDNAYVIDPETTTWSSAIDQSQYFLQSAAVEGLTTLAYENPDDTSTLGAILNSFGSALASNVAKSLFTAYSNSNEPDGGTYSKDFTELEFLEHLATKLTTFTNNYGAFVYLSFLVDGQIKDELADLEVFEHDSLEVTEYENSTAYINEAKTHFFDQAGQTLLVGNLTNTELSAKANAIYANFKSQNIDILNAASSLAFYSSVYNYENTNTATIANLADYELWLLVMPALVSYENSLSIYKEESWSVELANALKLESTSLVNQLLADKAAEVVIKTGLTVDLSNTTEAIKAIAYVFKDYYQGMGDASKDLFEYADSYQSGIHTTMTIAPNVGVLAVPSIDSYFNYNF